MRISRSAPFTAVSWSESSQIVKRGLRPRGSACSRRTRTQNEWKVLTVSSFAVAAPTRPATRSRISRAALLVKVIARMFRAETPFATRWAMRQVMTRVFPEPAPASTRTGPSVCSTARRCSEFSPSRRPAILPHSPVVARRRAGILSRGAALFTKSILEKEVQRTFLDGDGRDPGLDGDLDRGRFALRNRHPLDADQLAGTQGDLRRRLA